ncbi:RNA polymerase recycling motor ATPase HelR [Nakamurella deserti]|uniref:RNA polymerase recycling motor ATPase HelR n=1 Tax=Nakamurella deserti TaxID=2164074 RepID=UPI000DBE3EFB
MQEPTDGTHSAVDAREGAGDSVFDLPDRLRHKADPALIATDERFFADLAAGQARAVAELTGRLVVERRATDDSGNNEAVERDMRIHRLTGRLRTARRFGLDICLGHQLRADGSAPVWIGRRGLTDDDGRQLLVDWRSPAAEPFFGATHGDPMGLTRRRRYRWNRGRINDYWDEVFRPEDLDDATERAALDDQSAFIASLGAGRSARMRDVLGTIQADQDAVIRAASPGALVVDGGPGTGKTVVALHRAAFLLYADPRLRADRGGVLVVGPSRPYLAYVADVLPSLGEEGVRTTTLRDLVPEGAAAGVETDPEVARLKASTALVDAVEPAVRFHEEPPTTPLRVDTPWAELVLTAADWARAFDAVEPGTPHNEAREQIWTEVLDLLVATYRGTVATDTLRAALARHVGLRRAVTAAWPLVAAADLVSDLWSVPAYLRRCAPGLDREQVRRLQRSEPKAWTVSDLPLLDAAMRRLGDPLAARRRRERDAAVTAERAYRSTVIDDLIRGEDHDDGEGVMRMLRGEDLTAALSDVEGPGDTPADLLAGPFAHIVVDEAQELTDAEWRMLLARCPSRSFTVVGDRAQARHGFTESWRERLGRLGVDRIEVATLTVNYRTPEEVMAVAEPEIRAVLPDANVPVSIRRSGVPVRRGSTAELAAVLDGWLADHEDGIACVIGDPGFPERPRVRSLTPEQAKGLEFDLVVLVEPAAFGSGIEGAVDRYVAMTRATRQLTVLTAP